MVKGKMRSPMMRGGWGAMPVSVASQPVGAAEASVQVADRDGAHAGGDHHVAIDVAPGHDQHGIVTPQPLLAEQPPDGVKVEAFLHAFIEAR